MLISAVQMDIQWENQYVNMAKCERFIRKAHEENSRLIFFPEMSLTGFTMNVSSFNLSEDEILDWVKEMAEKYDISIGIGYSIRKNNKGQNKYVIAYKDGSIVSEYMKIHPFSYGEEDKIFDKGDRISYCKIDEADISTFICYDLRFPEIFQIASKKSNLITVAANWPKERMEHWHALLKARAIENQCYILGVNRCGEGGGLKYTGGTVFISPEGSFINEPSDGEKLITRQIDCSIIDGLRENFRVKDDRREDLYCNMFGLIKLQI